MDSNRELKCSTTGMPDDVLERHREMSRLARAKRACDDEEYSGDERENLLASIIVREDGDDFSDEKYDETDERKQYGPSQRHWHTHTQLHASYPLATHRLQLTPTLTLTLTVTDGEEGVLQTGDVAS